MDSKFLAVMIAVLGAVSVLYAQHDTKPEISTFESWKLDHSVKFDSMFEYAYRERIFLENLAKIELHNSQKHHTYTTGLNQFSALT